MEPVDSACGQTDSAHETCCGDNALRFRGGEHSYACVQNLDTWIGAPTDKWAFSKGSAYRGPITKGELAFYLDKGVLQPQNKVFHLSKAIAKPKARSEFERLGQRVAQW